MEALREKIMELGLWDVVFRNTDFKLGIHVYMYEYTYRTGEDSVVSIGVYVSEDGEFPVEAKVVDILGFANVVKIKLSIQSWYVG